MNKSNTHFGTDLISKWGIKSLAIIGGLFLLTSCVFNIDDDPDCLKCWYEYEGREYSEELCSPTYSQAEKNDMRTRMRMEADSLSVQFTCKED